MVIKAVDLIGVNETQLEYYLMTMALSSNKTRELNLGAQLEPTSTKTQYDLEIEYHSPLELVANYLREQVCFM